MSNKYQDVPEVFQENTDGTWSASVPLPFYGIRKSCSCGKKFWKKQNYNRHYVEAHTDGLKYKRNTDGTVNAIGRL